MTEQPEKAFCASFPRVPSVSHASTRLSSREMIKVSTFPSFRKKEVSNVADLIHFCPLVAFFQKNIKHPTRKGNLSRVSYLSFVAVPHSGVCVLRSFWRVFVSRASVGKKEERVFVFTKGDDIFIQRKDARAQKKKKKKERKNEREKESAFGGLFVRACVYIFIRGIRRRSSSSREREHFPALGEKRRRLVVHRFCERKRRKERKRSAKKKKTFWCR